MVRQTLPWIGMIGLAVLWNSYSFCGLKPHSYGATRLSALPPGKAKLPILGDTLEILNPKKMVTYQTESRERWGSTWKTSVLFKKAVVITGRRELGLESRPKAFEAFFPPHHQRLFGKTSLLVRSGIAHARLRKLIQSAMTPKKVEKYQAFIDLAVRDFLSSCRAETSYFSMTKKLQETTLRIVVQVLFGEDLGADELDYLRTNLRLWGLGLLSAPLNFIPWSTAARAMRARRKVEKVLVKWINQRSKQVDDTLLSQLLNATDEDGSSLSSQEVIDNVFTLVFAGIDTTASTLSSAILKLSQAADLQKLLREKVQETEATRYLESFLSEILRTNPPAPFSMRLDLGDITVPSGWLLVYGLGGSLSEAETFDEPQEFQLDRAQNQSVADSGAFGGGPRLCPGRFLASQAAQQVLAAILGKDGFQWTLQEGQDLEQQYIPGLFSADGLLLKLL